MKLSSLGLSVNLPDGWDGRIYAREDGLAALQAASFPLQPNSGEFGSSSVSVMPGDGAFLALVEYDRESASQALFAGSGRPKTVNPDDFDANAVAQGQDGRSGQQIFFNEAGRAFCLYLVAGSPQTRGVGVPAVGKAAGQMNAVLATLAIS